MGALLTGPEGATGLGATGATGPQGATGATGLQGSTGATGLQGSTGATGLQGATGLLGATGLDGEIGATGGVGKAGPPGPAGSAGPAGSPGLTGAPGPQGATGTQGAKGDGIEIDGAGDGAPIASTCNAGSVGNTYWDTTANSLYVCDGTNWIDTGTPVGLEGATGATGPKGADSTVAGPQGATGPTGPQGEGLYIDSTGDGPPTSDTCDAAALGSVYVDYTNNRVYICDGSDWQETGVAVGIEGKQGATGIQGATGQQGNPGVIGTPGETGATGMTGVVGPVGATGLQGEIGATGPEGPMGASVKIQGSVDTIDKLFDDHYDKDPYPGALFILEAATDTYNNGTGPELSGVVGDGFIYDGPIGGDPANSTKDSNWTQYYTNIGPIRGDIGATGPQGATGPDGDPTALLSVITVGTTGPAVLGGALAYNQVTGAFTYTPTVSDDWSMIPDLSGATSPIIP